MTKTSEDIYFSIAVTGMFYGNERPQFTIDIDGKDSESYLFDRNSKQTMEILFPANGLDFSVPHSLNITLTNKQDLEDLVSNRNAVIERAGIEIVNIAAVFMPSKQQFTSQSGYGPNDPHLIKFGEQTGMKFWLNGDILSKECKFYANEVKPVTGKNFRMLENGCYALEFRSPINYWVLQRFYVLDK